MQSESWEIDRPACEKCRFFKNREDRDYMPAAGECRRNPPVVLINANRARAYWPDVKCDAFCGEYRRKDF